MEATVWSKDSCPFCEKAIALLTLKNVNTEVRKLGQGWTKEQLLESVPHARSVPQIFIDGKYIGDYHKLVSYLN